MRGDRARALALAVLSASCGEELPPRGQVRLFVTTDAVLPAGPGEVLGGDEPAPLFDRLRIDLLAPDDVAPCADCSRVFPLDRRLVDEGRASMGVIPPPGASGFRARLRIYRSSSRPGTEPRAEATLDATFALPAVPEEGIVDVTAVLLTDFVGVRLGDHEPLAPEPGPPPAGLVGTWWGAQRVACSGASPPGMACVPGGAFWMGNPDVGVFSYDPIVEGNEERLVVVSPFHLDTDETTVARYREDALVYGVRAFPWSGDDSGASVIDGCTFTLSPSDRDGLPLTCMGWWEARDYCARRGAQLPTEAQLEYAAGGLASRLYPWGTEDPACEDAVHARDLVLRYGADACRAPGTPGGPLPIDRPDRRDRDRVELPGGAVLRDLAGSTKEWAADDWNRQDEPCWAAPGVHVDPRCTSTESADGPAHRAFGGYWGSVPAELRVAIRSFFPEGAASDAVGVRCAGRSD